MPPPSHNVQQIINAMKQARHGGDYAALFAGKKLAFKFNSLRAAASELREASGDVADALSPVVDAASDLPVFNALMAIAKIIKDGGAAMVSALKKAFQGLLDVFASLKQALETALQPLMNAMNLVIGGVIDLLFDLLPNAFVELVKGLVAAVLPFVGQIKACGSMLLAVGGAVKLAIERNHLIHSAAAVDEGNRFGTSARNAVTTIINQELRGSVVAASMETVNAGASVAGLVFTGNVGSMVAGIATAVAKLCLLVADLLGDCRMMQRGNALLAKMGTDPRRDVNPAALFNAAPLLGCYYIGSATQSSLIANTGFLDSFSLRMTTTDASWQAQYLAKAQQLSDFRLKAMQVCLASRLELTTESRHGIYLDLDPVDEARSYLSGAVTGAMTSAASGAVMARLAG